MSKLLLLQLQLLLLLLVDTDNVAKAFAFGTVTNDCSGSGSRRQTFLTASGTNKSCYDLMLRQRKIKLSGNGSSKLLGSQSSLPETFIATSITTTTKLDDSELKPRRRQKIRTGRRMGGRRHHQKLTSQKKKTATSNMLYSMHTDSPLLQEAEERQNKMFECNYSKVNIDIDAMVNDLDIDATNKEELKKTLRKIERAHLPPPLHLYLGVYYLYCLSLLYFDDVNLSVWFALCGIITIKWYWFKSRSLWWL